MKDLPSAFQSVIPRICTIVDTDVLKPMKAQLLKQMKKQKRLVDSSRPMHIVTDPRDWLQVTVEEQGGGVLSALVRAIKTMLTSISMEPVVSKLLKAYALLSFAR